MSKVKIIKTTQCPTCKSDVFSTTKHPNRKYCSRRCSKLGSSNPQWRADKVSYNALHTWINTHLTKPNSCQKCGENKKLDAANISGEYKRDFSDWEWLCRSCHMKTDGRINNLIKNTNVLRIVS